MVLLTLIVRRNEWMWRNCTQAVTRYELMYLLCWQSIAFMLCVTHRRCYGLSPLLHVFLLKFMKRTAFDTCNLSLPVIHMHAHTLTLYELANWNSVMDLFTSIIIWTIGNDKHKPPLLRIPKSEVIAHFRNNRFILFDPIQNQLFTSASENWQKYFRKCKERVRCTVNRMNAQ